MHAPRWRSAPPPSPPLYAEDHALAGVEVGRGEVELAIELTEVVGAPGLAEHLAQVALYPRAVVEPGREPIGEADDDVHQRGPAGLGEQLASKADGAQWHRRALAQVVGEVRSQQIPDGDVLEGKLALVVTTRIISSGVTPFAHSAAMNAPAEVPTYTSKLLTVLFTASRSSARSAPISYTPP